MMDGDYEVLRYQKRMEGGKEIQCRRCISLPPSSFEVNRAPRLVPTAFSTVHSDLGHGAVPSKRHGTRRHTQAHAQRHTRTRWSRGPTLLPGGDKAITAL